MARGAATKEPRRDGRPSAGGSAARNGDRSTRRRGRRLAVYAVLAALAVGFGAWALYGSPWLRVEHVSVTWTEGPETLDPGAVEDAAAVPLGAPMASLDKAAVRERVLRELPRARTVEVVRAWPHGVGVRVTEREAAVQLAEDGRFTSIDAEGVPFARLPEAADGVPLLELAQDGEETQGRFDTDRVRAGAAGVPDELPADLRDAVATVHAPTWDTITLELTDGRTVLWGSPEHPAEKRAALEAVLGAEPEADHVDVSVPSAPAAAVG